jgi:hypothetical protein
MKITNNQDSSLVGILVFGIYFCRRYVSQAYKENKIALTLLLFHFILEYEIIYK